MDDFFALIRSVHERRDAEPAFERLAFCLLGVASPAELMKDPRRTPFNIGVAVPLEDFTEDEARVFLPWLAGQSAGAQATLDEVLRWSGGHPYMTHKLCSLLHDQDLGAGLPEQVERIVRERFILSGRAEEQSLSYAERCFFDRQNTDRIVARMLDQYQLLLDGETIPFDDGDAAHFALRLSGMAARRKNREGTFLAVRNRIFATAFDQAWVRNKRAERLITGPLDLWLRADRSDDHVLRGQALEEAEEWAAHRADLSQHERAFLLASQRMERRERDQRHQARMAASDRLAAERARIRNLVLIVLFLVLLGAFLGMAWVWRVFYIQVPAETERQLSAARELARALDDMHRHEGKNLARANGTRWAVLLGQGELQEELGMTGQALSSYALAERTLDEISRAVPAGRQREAFLRTHERSSVRAVDLLLRLKRLSDALEVIRRARLRALRGPGILDREAPSAALINMAPGTEAEKCYWRERAELDGNLRAQAVALQSEHDTLDLWRKIHLFHLGQCLQEAPSAITQEKLRDPQDGEVLLACYPVTLGWTCIAADRDQVQSSPLDEPKPESPKAELARQMLMPFAGQIRRARRLRFLPDGPTQDVEVQALPFEGHPLSEQIEVVYALDLPDRSTGDVATTALMATDPYGDLSMVHGQAPSLKQTLAKAGWDVIQLTGPPPLGKREGSHRGAEKWALTGAALRARLAVAQLFLYMGRLQDIARFRPGDPVGETALVLPEEAGLLPEDVLLAAHVPSWVVLAGTEETKGSTPDLVRAFVGRGSKEVIIAVRPITEVLGIEVMRLLLQGEAGKRPPDLVQALRQAQLALRKQSPQVESLRAYVP